MFCDIMFLIDVICCVIGKDLIMEEQTKSKIGLRMWMFLILVGFVGQLAWSIENMYLNTYITYINFSAPLEERFDYSLYIALTTAFSAVVATLTTIFMGALTDKIGHKKYFISFGYLFWGISTASFGLFNVNSKNEMIPIAMVSSMAAIMVIIIDCVMTFFGSTANDAAFNSYITKNIDEKNKGKVEGVLSILPLIAMLIIFVVLNGFTTDSKKGANDARWDLFFYLIGAVVLIMGVVSFFLIPKEKEEKNDTTYLKLLVSGFKKDTIKKNSKLYLVLIIYFVYAVACQVFFPYLMVYLEKTCEIANTGSGFLTPFAMVMAIALIVGSSLSVVFGFLSDKYGKDRMIIPSFIVFGIGILLMFFIPMVSSSDSVSRTVYAAVAGLVMILGYVGVPTVINALVRQYIPKGEEGIFMGVRMLFVVALPMCIGPFIGDAFNRSYGSQIPSATFDGVYDTVPSSYGYLMGLAILVLSIIPIYFYLRKVKSEKHASNQETVR